MSDATELDFINGGLLDHLYTHEFANRAGRFFNVITDEEGTTVEYEEPGVIRNRLKLTLTFVNEGKRIKSVTLKKFKFYKNDGWVEQYFGPTDPFSLTHFSFEKLVGFLHVLVQADLASVNERRIPLAIGNPNGFSPETARELRALLLQPEGQRIIRELVKSGQVTPGDILNIDYRKRQLAQFEALLEDAGAVEAYAALNDIRTDQPEKAWQHFFKKNEWIFGLGLDYRFLGLLQEEALIGEKDVAGHDGAVADYLLGATNFTVLVEIKRPDTELFAARQNRSNAWRLSKDLFDAVSQILEQKASWQIKSEVNFGSNFTSSGELVTQRTLDPKCVLIVGSNSMFSGTERERAVKLRTFELFRRDSRNIEILTYDEVLERARFILSHTQALGG
ncbi:MAG: Shedu immune nuclease family protein [Devosia sp.]